MKTKLYILLTLLVCSLTAFAQDHTITGKVLDENGQPLSLISVSVKGTHKAVNTADDGTYTIQAAPNNTLVFSFVGYDRQNIKVGNRSQINIVMKESSSMKMQDLVVVGYSKVERRDLTGSVSSVKPKDNVSFQSVDQMLQGRVPGLFMSN